MPLWNPTMNDEDAIPLLVIAAKRVAEGRQHGCPVSGGCHDAGLPCNAHLARPLGGRSDMTDETAGVSEGRRAFSMTEVEGRAFDLLQDHGLPSTLDGICSVCRTIAKWHREDREPKFAAKLERIAGKLHALSLEA